MPEAVMKPGSTDGPPRPISEQDEARSPNQQETGAERESGLTAVADEELEFFDTVGLESERGIDAFTYAGVRIRH
jgi:hypothetical protein